MYRITKQEHNDVLGKVYALADCVDVITGIIRNWLLNNSNHVSVKWHAIGKLFATVTFREGVEVKWFVEPVEVAS